MSHEVETMPFDINAPWHGLGVPVSNDLTPAQMMKKAGLDWRVKKVPTFIEHNGRKIPTNRHALIRETDGEVLTIVGENWNHVQNETAFNFFTEYCLSGDMEMCGAGSLKDGQMVWALAKIKESFELFGGDRVGSYLLFSNPHQWGKAIDVQYILIRLICLNGLVGVFGESIKIGHHIKFDAREVKTALGIASDQLNDYKKMAEFLGSKRFDEDEYIRYLNEVFPKTDTKNSQNDRVNIESLSKTARKAYDALNQQPGAQFARGSWWQAYNSVTYVVDHVQGVSRDSRLYSAWFGKNKIRKAKALGKAMEFAEAA